MLHSNILSNKSFFYSDYAGEEIVDLLSITYKPPMDFQAQAVGGDEDYQGRPDLISKILYDNEMYTDIICKLNNISNPLAINGEDVLVVPMPSGLSNFYCNPDDRWEEKSEATTKKASNIPKPKQPSSTRKPNEAVVGDRRFNIDPKNNVVIY